MIFKCQTCGKLFPIDQGQPRDERNVEMLHCPKCYMERAGTNVRADWQEKHVHLQRGAEGLQPQRG